VSPHALGFRTRLVVVIGTFFDYDHDQRFADHDAGPPKKVADATEF
jgi:hypothetical protein